MNDEHFLPREDGDYPLWLLIAIKKALLAVIEDPELEQARAILAAIDAAIASDARPRTAEVSGNE